MRYVQFFIAKTNTAFICVTSKLAVHDNIKNARVSYCTTAIAARSTVFFFLAGVLLPVMTTSRKHDTTGSRHFSLIMPKRYMDLEMLQGQTDHIYERFTRFRILCLAWLVLNASILIILPSALARNTDTPLKMGIHTHDNINWSICGSTRAGS